MAVEELEFNLEDLLVGMGAPAGTEENDTPLEMMEVEENKNDDEIEIDINDVLGQAKEKDEDSEDTSKKSPQKVESTTSQENKDSSDSYALAFARYLLERGNLTDLNEEELTKVIEDEGDDAATAWMFQTEVDRNREAIRNELLDQYEDDVKAYLELVDEGVGHDTASRIAKDKTFYDKLNVDELEDDDKSELREKILTSWYKETTKFTDARIKKMVDNHVALGEDVELSKEAVGDIKDIRAKQVNEEKTKAIEAEKNAAKAREDSLKELRTKIDGLDEVFKGYKINKQTKDKIHDMIVKPVAQDNYGNPVNAIWKKRMEDPIKFDTTLAYLMALEVFDGKSDKLLKPAKSNAVSDLERSLKSKKFGSKPASDPTEVGSLGQSLAQVLGLPE